MEKYIIDSGYTAQRLTDDYGFDLVLKTFDARGYAEPGSILHPSESVGILQEARGGWVYDLDVRDYNLWMREIMPVVLVLFDATRRRA
jgi:hypothetical protein